MADSCRFYRYEGGFFSGGNTCSVTGRKENVTEDYYVRYCKHDYNRRDCPLYRKYGPYESSGCFITTVTCEILGQQDNSLIMNHLRNFRDNVLQTNEKYYDILKEYDVIGPKLADCIRQDKDREVMANGLYKNVLVPVSQLVNDKDYDKAVETYYVMTLMLINYYGLKHQYNAIKDDNYGYDDFEPSKAGHGRVKKKIYE